MRLRMLMAVVIMILAAIAANATREHFGSCQAVVPPANCSRSWMCFSKTPMRIGTNGMAECQALNNECVVHATDAACQSWADTMNNTRLQTNSILESTYQVKQCNNECTNNNSVCSVALREIPRFQNCLPNTRSTI